MTVLTMTCAVAMLVPALWSSVPAVAVAMVVIGAAWTGVIVLLCMAVQTAVPDVMRVRMLSALVTRMVVCSPELTQKLMRWPLKRLPDTIMAGAVVMGKGKGFLKRTASHAASRYFSGSWLRWYCWM